MATLTNGTTLSAALSLTSKTGKISFATQNTFVDKNIEVDYTIPGVVLTKPSSGTNTFYVTIPNGASGTVTLNFSVDSSGNTTIT